MCSGHNLNLDHLADKQGHGPPQAEPTTFSVTRELIYLIAPIGYSECSSGWVICFVSFVCGPYSLYGVVKSVLKNGTVAMKIHSLTGVFATARCAIP